MDALWPNFRRLNPKESVSVLEAPVAARQRACFRAPRLHCSLKLAFWILKSFQTVIAPIEMAPPPTAFFAAGRARPFSVDHTVGGKTSSATDVRSLTDQRITGDPNIAHDLSRPTDQRDAGDLSIAGDPCEVGDPCIATD